MPLAIQFLLYMLIGWVTRQQAEVIEYLKAENLALREKLGGKRLRFTDAQRRRLARKASHSEERGFVSSHPSLRRIPCCAGIASSLPGSMTGARGAARVGLELPARSVDTSCSSRDPSIPWLPGRILS
jgi:hypothetical protein